jgi:hypothetical protein
MSDKLSPSEYFRNRLLGRLGLLPDYPHYLTSVYTSVPFYDTHSDLPPLYYVMIDERVKSLLPMCLEPVPYPGTVYGLIYSLGRQAVSPTFVG